MRKHITGALIALAAAVVVRRRGIATVACEAVGLGLVAVGTGMLLPAAGVIVAGLALTAIGYQQGGPA